MAVTQADAFGADLWTHSFSRNESTRRTFDEGRESLPVWKPNGDYLYFESGSCMDMFRLPLNGDGDVERLTNTLDGMFPSSVLHDGRVLMYEAFSDRADGRNIGILDPETGEIEYQLQSKVSESHPRLSPDGELIAYVSDRSGESEVYVQRFPVDDDDWTRVSNSGDNWSPQRAADSRELFYWDHDDALMYSAFVDRGEKLRATRPVALFRTDPCAWELVNNFDFDQTRDKFLLAKKPLARNTDDETVLIQNWPTLLER